MLSDEESVKKRSRSIHGLSVPHTDPYVEGDLPAQAHFFLRNSLTSGMADSDFVYGKMNDKYEPAFGDWDGNGTDTVGLFEPATSTFFLRNANTSGMSDVTVKMEHLTGAAIAGVWRRQTAAH